MEIQGWLYVCDIRGIPAHQLSCGQPAPTVWIEKHCTLSGGRLWIVGSELFDRVVNEGDHHRNNLGGTEIVSSTNKDVFAHPRAQREAFTSEATSDSRKYRPVDGLLKSDAQDSLINKSFLQKKISPSIRRTRNMMPGKENRPYVNMTGLVAQGVPVKQPESEVGSSFFTPVIETPDMLDLSCEQKAIVRPLHQSILGKEHCFEVITVNGSRCFCCKSAGEREAWIEKIRRTLNPNLDNSRRTEHQLNLWIQEAKGVPIKKKYFCEICLDRQLYARTTSKLKDDNTTFWGEHFDFTSIPLIENITVHLYKDSDKKKKKDKDYVGLVNISVQTLSNRQTLEKWYTLSTPSGKNKNNSGEIMAIRIRARFQSICILPMEQYKEFAEFISNDYLQLCKIMHVALPVSKKDELSRSLVSIMHSTGAIKDFMTELVMNDIANVEEESLIFRENTIATKAVEHFLRLIGIGYLHEALGDFVTALYDSDEDCEVDGSRLPASAVLEHNQKNLQMCCEIAMCKIINSIKIFPNELREVFSIWRVQCEANGRPRIASRLITASLFLRLLCPAILNPSLFGLANEMPRPNAARTLTLVAKVIQNLANRTRFGDKEEYMKFMNGFVREQWDQMGGFLDDVADATKTSAANGFQGFIDLGRELAKLHAFLTEAMSEIDQNLLNDLEHLPMILSSISESSNNPPASDDEVKVKHASKSTLQHSSLDKIAKDVHLSYADDNVLVSSESSSTPCGGHPDIRSDSYSLLDMVTGGFPTSSIANLSENGNQNSNPANNGSFNNSNNSERPSLLSMENLTEITGQTHHSNKISRPSIPLFFSNPAYTRPHISDFQRAVSYPSELLSLALDYQVGEKEIHFAPTNCTELLSSAHPLEVQLDPPTTVISTANPDPIKSQIQPLSFSNPLLSVLRPSAVPRPTSTCLSQSVTSNSQVQTVFTTEGVTYTARSPHLQLRCEKADVSKPEKTIRHVEGMEQDSSDADTANDSYRSNDTLSSRPSSTTTESTATSGHNAKQSRGYSILPKPKDHTHKGDAPNTYRPQGKRSNNGGQVPVSEKIEPKLTAIATSTSIPVSSARHRTGLQKQQQRNSSLNSLQSGTDLIHSRSGYVASNDKSSSRAVRLSSLGGSKNIHNKSQHPKHCVVNSNPNCVKAVSEELPVGKKVDGTVMPGKGAPPIAISGNTTRVRVARKTRPCAVPSNNFQTFHQSSIKTNSAGEYYGNGRGSYSYQQTPMQVANLAPAELVAFPPTTPEGPLSPEERTAHWILNSVASVAKERVVQASNSTPYLVHNQTKSKTSNKEQDDLMARLQTESAALRVHLAAAEESNRALKQREDALLGQIKESDRREAHLQEKVRIIEEKMTRQIQEKDDIKSDLLRRISEVDDDQKIQREELQGVINEKDIIVSAQRKRIACLEEANARLKRLVSDYGRATTTAVHQRNAEMSLRACSCQEVNNETFIRDLPANNSRCSESCCDIGHISDRNQRRQSLHINLQKCAPTSSSDHGECRVSSFSSGGSSSS